MVMCVGSIASSSSASSTPGSGRIVADVVVRGEARDHPAVLPRVEIPVDAGHAELAALGIAQRVVFVAVGIVIEVGVLADIECPVGALQEGDEVTLDVARGGEIFR